MLARPASATGTEESEIESENTELPSPTFLQTENTLWYHIEITSASSDGTAECTVESVQASMSRVHISVAPIVLSSTRSAEVAESDALWIFSPEYNYSYPGHLKNLIDWLSRPLVAGDRQTPLAINGKKVALSGAGGAAGTAKCREKLTELLTLPFIRADVKTEPQTGIQLSKEAWTEGRMVLNEAQRESLKLQVAAFMKYLG